MPCMVHVCVHGFWRAKILLVASEGGSDNRNKHKGEIIRCTMNYQPEELLKKRYFVSSLPPVGGVRCESDEPTNFAGEDEWSEFETGWQSSDMYATTMPIRPPLFRFMMLMDELKMLPHEAIYHAQRWTKEKGDTGDSTVSRYYKERRPEQCPKLATNPNFVSIPDNHVVRGTEQHYDVTDDDGVFRGDSYKVGKDGRIHFPGVFYASTRGFIIKCERQYMRRKKAEVHLLNGTGDILGTRTVLSKDESYNEILFLVRTYHTTFSFCTKYRRRNFAGSSYHLGNEDTAKASVASMILTAHTGSRPPGHVAHHIGESWCNEWKNLGWVTVSENNMKKNQDPQQVPKGMLVIYF
jgi:hypothetical protein